MEIDINNLLGLPQMEVTEFSFSEKKVYISLKRVTESEQCPVCQCCCSRVRSYATRKVRDLDILGRKTYLSIQSRQFECTGCPRYFLEDIEIVEGNHGFTKRYESYLYKMIKGINIQQVRLKEDVCWGTLNAIYKAHSSLELSKREVNWSTVKSISIDEIAVRKGKRNFACVLRDPDSDQVLDMLEKRDMTTLKAYFTGKGVDFCNQIEHVISDMWDGYVNLAGEKGVFKNAINVIDLFHFVQHLGAALDGERKAARKKFPQSACLKSLRWTVLKSPEDLNEAESIQLKEAFKVSATLARIYQLRIDLKAIFQKNHTKQTGLDAITKWEEEAKKIGNYLAPINDR